MSEDKSQIAENVNSPNLSSDSNNEKIILPKNYVYRVLHYKGSNDFYFECLANLKTKEDALKWVELYESINKVSLKISHSGYRDYISMQYKCHHNTNGKESVKNTRCGFKLNIVIFNSSSNLQRMRDVYTCKIKIMNSHNHSLHSPAVLSHRKVASATKEKLQMLYRQGHSIVSAKNYLELEIENELQDGEVLSDKLADRSIMPDYNYRWTVYKKEIKETYEHNNTIQYFIDLYNKEFDEPCIKIDGDLIAICTTVMQRAHRHLVESSEVVFVDSFGRKSKDQDGFRIFLFISHSYAGGMPLAIGITNSESSDSLIQLFQLIKSMLPEYAFGGRGEMGPLNFVTEDADAEQIALKTIWPDSQLYLCQFNVLQAVWRWLIKESHGIHINDRQFCISFFRSLMYSTSESRLLEIYNEAINEDIIIKYPQFRNYIIELLERRDKWVHYTRIGAVLKENNTNNYAEVAISVFKDEIFNRTKIYNKIQLVHHLAFPINSYYMQKALKAVHSQSLIKKEFTEDLSDRKIEMLENNIYSVSSRRNADVFYTVDIALKTCSCISSSTAKQYCKHVAFCLDSNFKDYASNSSLSDRNNLYIIGTGTNAPLEWLIPLHQQKILQNQPNVTNPPVHSNTDNAFRNFLDDDSIESSDPMDTSMNLQDDKEMMDQYVTLFRDKIKSLFESHPNAARAAMRSFGKSLESISSSDLLSSLHQFGKSLGQGKYQLISLHVNSNARRKRVSEGRKLSRVGRPRKNIHLDNTVSMQ